MKVLVINDIKIKNGMEVFNETCIAFWKNCTFNNFRVCL
jgi:hypothetical protein